MNKILQRIGTGAVSNRCLFSLSLMVTPYQTEPAQPRRECAPFLQAAAHHHLLLHCQLPLFFSGTVTYVKPLSIPLVSQTIRQNRPYAFIEAPHPPSFLHLPHCLIPLSSVSGNPGGRCSTAQPGTNSQPWRQCKHVHTRIYNAH